MKKILCLFVILTGTVLPANTCTTFFINKNGQMVFGRNYDWISGTGMVCVNLKGLSKTSMKTRDGETISWVSQYGSITFNQYGKEFPTGGMNEKGLVVELMWLDGTRYPDADNRPAVGVLQWIQYHLDNCATVDELVAMDKNLRIASTGTTPLHYLVADAKGNVAAIEFLDGKMVVHKGTDLPVAVLTNDSYKESVQLTSSATGSNGSNGSAFTSNSIDRFAKACTMVKQFQQSDISTPVIDYSFEILNKVAQGSHTKWSIVYDMTNKKIHFNTLGHHGVKWVDFSSFDLSCSSISKAIDMNQDITGDISRSFEQFSLDLNRRIVEKAFKESSTQIQANEKALKATWQYPEGISCAQKPPGNHP